MPDTVSYPCIWRCCWRRNFNILYDASEALFVFDPVCFLHVDQSNNLVVPGWRMIQGKLLIEPLWVRTRWISDPTVVIAGHETMVCHLSAGSVRIGYYQRPLVVWRAWKIVWGWCWEADVKCSAVPHWQDVREFDLALVWIRHVRRCWSYPWWR